MAKFNIGDRVRVNITIGSIYDKSGTITSYAQVQYESIGQCYTVPRWRVQLDDGESICIRERYLNPERERRK